MPAPNGAGQLLAANEAMVPNVVVIATLIDLAYIVPVDDTQYFQFLMLRCKAGENGIDLDEKHLGKTWWELTDEEHQASPGDYEAQSSIGRLPAHNLEHLRQATSPSACCGGAWTKPCGTSPRAAIRLA